MVRTIAKQNADLLVSLTNVVDQYLNESARRWVDMSEIVSVISAIDIR